MPSEGAAKAPLYNSAGRTATTPDESNQAQRAADMKLSSRLADTYDFLADIEGGNSQALPFLDALDPSVSSSALQPTGLRTMPSCFRTTLPDAALLLVVSTSVRL